MRTAEPVQNTSHRALEHNGLDRAARAVNLAAARGEIKSLLGAKELGAFAANDKLSRLGDKVVAAALAAGGSVDEIAAFARALSLPTTAYQRELANLVPRGCRRRQLPFAHEGSREKIALSAATLDALTQDEWTYAHCSLLWSPLTPNRGSAVLRPLEKSGVSSSSARCIRYDKCLRPTQPGVESERTERGARLRVFRTE